MLLANCYKFIIVYNLGGCFALVSLTQAVNIIAKCDNLARYSWFSKIRSYFVHTMQCGSVVITNT